MPATYLGARVAGYRPPRPMRVGILGAFGTIGRASLLALSRREDKAFFRVSFLHDRLSDIESAVRLLRNPSAYETGIDVKVGDAKTLLLEDAEVKCYYDAAPSDLPLSEVDLVLDCTGKHNRGQDLRQYLPADGVLLLPAFSHQMDANLIIGFNDREFDPSRHRMVGIGSCSMNAVVLVLGIIRELGLESAVLSVLHCADRDQSVVDVVSHKDPLGMSSLGGFFTIDSRSLANVSVFFPELEGRIVARNTRLPVTVGMKIEATLELREGNPQKIRDLLVAAEGMCPDLLRLIAGKSDHNRIAWGKPQSAFVNVDAIATAGGLTCLSMWQDPHLGFSHRLWDMARIVGARVGWSCPGVEDSTSVRPESLRGR